MLFRTHSGDILTETIRRGRRGSTHVGLMYHSKYLVKMCWLHKWTAVSIRSGGSTGMGVLPNVLAYCHPVSIISARCICQLPINGGAACFDPAQWFGSRSSSGAAKALYYINMQLTTSGCAQQMAQ